MRAGVYTATAGDGHVSLLRGREWGERLGLLAPPELAALRTLATGWHLEADLPAASRPLLHRLHAGGWLDVRHELGGRPLVTVRPLGPHRARTGGGQRTAPTAPAAPGGPGGASASAALGGLSGRVPAVVPAEPLLSRFAVLRRDGDHLVLESPLASAAVVVHDAAVTALVHQLAAPAGEAAGVVDLPPPVVSELVAVLAAHGLVHDAAEERRPDLAGEQWSPHELWFHARSRGGYHDQPLGGTLWAAGRFDPLPARRARPPDTTGTRVELAGPEPAVAAPGPAPGFDASLDAVLRARRSIREQDGDRPLTVRQLGEFLHRCARVTQVAADGRQQVSLRPSPSGGALHGLELYPVVTRVDGLAAGMYHYDPFGHALDPVCGDGPLVRRLAALAGQASGAAVPQVLLVASCRFGRVMWKYQGMAYALVLKDLGALFQTMYLVATAMGLAPCALGCGDVELFAAATGLDPRVESSVGEFMLGSRAAR